MLDQRIGGKRPATLDLTAVRVAAADTIGVTLQGIQLALEPGQVGKVTRQRARVGHLWRLHLDTRLAQQHATAPAGPDRLLALDGHQPPALALGRQPNAVARRVDRQAFEQGVEVQQHAAGPGLSHHGRVDLQPVRLAFEGDLQDSGVGLADQVQVTGLITGDAFEVQLATANIGGRPVA
ncbi:hypothetical protein D3C81_1619740 [compost metagenome]